MRLTVFGEAIPQGSKTGYVVNGRAVITEGKRSASLKQWRASIAACARLWLSQNGAPPPIDGPVTVTIAFYMPRPKSAPKRVKFPATRPDADKLVRSVLDALTKLAYTDDSRIVNLHVYKRFAINTPPHAIIVVAPANEESVCLSLQVAS